VFEQRRTGAKGPRGAVGGRCVRLCGADIPAAAAATARTDDQDTSVHATSHRFTCMSRRDPRQLTGLERRLLWEAAGCRAPSSPPSPGP
jgi:hypothetical protein